jgi:hypothetical protein
MSDFTFYSMIVWTGVVVFLGLLVATIKRTEDGVGGFGLYWLVTTVTLWLVGFALWGCVQIKQYIDNYGMPFTGSG